MTQKEIYSVRAAKISQRIPNPCSRMVFCKSFIQFGYTSKSRGFPKPPSARVSISCLDTCFLEGPSLFLS